MPWPRRPRKAAQCRTRPRSTQRSAISSRGCKARSTARLPPNKAKARRTSKICRKRSRRSRRKLRGAGRGTSRRRHVGPRPRSSTTLDQRIAKLEATLPELSTAIRPLVGKRAKSGAAAIAFANLRNAVAAGRPYAAELAALKSLIPDLGDLSALPSHAETGIPTVAALADALTKLAEASAAPRAGPSPDLDPRQHDGERKVGDFHPPHRRRRDRGRACRRAGKSRSSAEPRRSCRRHQGGRVAACASARSVCRLARRCTGPGLRQRHSLSKLESTVLVSLGGGAAPEAKP